MKSLLVLISALALATGCQAPRPKNLGLTQSEGENAVLKPCPESPNCIGSHYPKDQEHFLKPIKYQLPKEQARERIIKILKKTDRVNLVSEEQDYIHAEFTSAVFKFVDDVEFNLSEEPFIHFRSASRMGHSDLGANKKRMNEIIFRFYQNDM